LRLLYWGELACVTGFGIVAGPILRTLALAYPHWKFLAAAMLYDGGPHDFPFPLVPISLLGPFSTGEGTLLELLDEFRPDFLFSYTCLELLNGQGFSPLRKKPLFKFLVEAKERLHFTWLHYFPVEYQLTKHEVAPLEKVDYPICFHEDVVTELKRFGIESFCIPHGIDLEKFYPSEQMRREGREMLGVKPDEFLIASVFRNDIRKDPVQLLRIFARAVQKEPRLRLYLHTNTKSYERIGFDLVRFAERLGVPSGTLIFPEDFREVKKPKFPEYLLRIYNAADLYLSTSLGEGFGLPVREAQACGVPVMAPAHTGLREAVEGGRGIPLKFGTSEEAWIPMPIIDGSALCPQVEVKDGVEKVLWACNARKELKEIAEEGFNYVRENHDLRRIQQQWIDFFGQFIKIYVP